MGYVIIDLEFNNLNNITKYYPKFYENYNWVNDLTVQNEIIEIGAIKVDQYMKVKGKLKAYIKPSILPILNPEIANITNITEDDLKTGISFEEGMEKLKEFAGDDVLCSWAKDDIAQIIINAHHHEYEDLKWIRSYLDIQEYASNVIGVKKSLSLKNALKRLNIRIDDSLLHDALNDAEFTVQVFRKLYNHRIVKNYIVENIYDMPAITVKELEGLLLDNDMVKSLCPRCKKKIQLDFEYMPLRWRFISVGKCSKCNASVLNEVVVKKSLHGKIMYYEIGSIVDEVDYSDYSYKLDKYFLKKEKAL
ncbi:MAG: exonuclease domain-containing protein [Clostridium sp.]|uniref:exonuclease domain-containing protein n=1 Tax=Clostridium sp. TaxID=1506 RepID=UPI003F2C657A